MKAAVQQPFDVRLMNATAAVLFTGCVVLLLAAFCWWALRHPLFAGRGSVRRASHPTEGAYWEAAPPLRMRT